MMFVRVPLVSLASGTRMQVDLRRSPSIHNLQASEALPWLLILFFPHNVDALTFDPAVEREWVIKRKDLLWSRCRIGLNISKHALFQSLLDWRV